MPDRLVTTPEIAFALFAFTIPKLPVVYVNPTPVIDVTRPTLM